jgi:hypothetical protein
MWLILLACAETQAPTSTLVYSEAADPPAQSDDTGGAADTDAGAGDDTGDGSGDDSGDGIGDDTGGPPVDTDPPETFPDIPTGGCGAEPYDWVALEGMGEIVEIEEAGELRLSADAVSLALALFGLEDFAPVPYGVRVWRVRYITQDRGQAVEATGLISLPDVSEPLEVPVLLYLHPTMGFTDECAPTALGLEGAAFNIIFSSLGMAVATPDYLGMHGWGEPAGFLHPYVSAEPTAVASLDALRAMHRFTEDADVNVTTDPAATVIWGASEGGFAALWADRYAPYYAPEYGVSAVVAAVPPTDLMGLAQEGVEALNDTSWALAAVFATVNPWYGDPAPLSDALTDEDPTYFASTLPALMGESCTDFGDPGSVSEVADIYQQPMIDAILAGDVEAGAPFTCYLDDSSLTKADRVPLASDSPVFITTASDDTLVHAAPTRDAVPTLCEMGYRIEYLECAGAGHVDGAVDSIPAQWEWIQARLAGEPLEQTCVVTEPVECVGLGI